MASPGSLNHHWKFAMETKQIIGKSNGDKVDYWENYYKSTIPKSENYKNLLFSEQEIL